MLIGCRAALLRVSHRAAESSKQKPPGIARIDVIGESHGGMADVGHALTRREFVPVARMTGVIDELDLRQNESGRRGDCLQEIRAERETGAERRLPPIA